MTIFKETTGKGEKDVVLLHGWGCDHRHMQPLVDLLAPHYRVHNYDLPGRGYSDWKEGSESIHDIADAMLDDLPENAIYIGWSYGGLISVSIAARYPEMVERYIGIGSIPKFIEDENWPAVAKPGFTDSFGKAVEAVGFRQSFIDYYDMEFEGVPHDADTYGRLIDSIDLTVETTKLEVLFKGLEIVDAADLREEFKAIKCPIDLILSSKDHSVPPAIHPYLKELKPEIKIHIVEDAQHMSFWTHQDQFNKILKDILDIN